jgi:hypothetical protein
MVASAFPSIRCLVSAVGVVLLPVLLLAGCGAPGEEAGKVGGTASGGAVAEGPSSSDRPVGRDTLTVTGVMIDVTCHARRPEAPRTCEGEYVRAGYPVGIRMQGAADSVWILVAVPQALADYLRSPARATGVVRSDGVLVPHALQVRTGRTWTTVM